MENKLLKEFCENLGIQNENNFKTIEEVIDYTDFDDIGMDEEAILQQYKHFLEYKANLENIQKVESVTIIGGVNKTGIKEDVNISLVPGDVISIVGPTGSGKSRLLEDIEWIAQNDTPTQRTILINDATPSEDLRFSIETKLVAQLSQNMNFVMDTSVQEFVLLHAESRGVANAEEVTKKIIKKSNELAGEQFTNLTPLTSLSGGQSRALMIADTAYLSNSPIVLIDEIENAGIDRRKALDLLVKNEKIIIMATHDPILALMAEKRLVIKNGGIHKILTTSQKEKDSLIELEKLDKKLMDIRNRLRHGESIDV